MTDQQTYTEQPTIRTFGSKDNGQQFTIGDRAFSARGISLPELELIAGFERPDGKEGAEALRHQLQQVCPFLAERAKDGGEVTAAWLEQTLNIAEIAELFAFIADIADGSFRKVNDALSKAQVTNRNAQRRSEKLNKQ